MNKKPAYEDLERRIKTLEEETIEGKRAEEILQQTEDRFRLITDNVGDIIWLMDMNLQTTWISPSVEQKRGFTLAELQSLPLERHLTPESLRIALGLIEKNLSRERLADAREKIIASAELEFYRKDGSTFWADTIITLLRDRQGIPTGFLGLSRDTTERRGMEEALRESERKYRLITEKMTDIVWITDMELRTVYVTPSIQTVLGFSMEERMLQTVDQQLTPDSLSFGLDAMAQELALEEQDHANPKRNATLVLEYYHKDGSTRWMETTIGGIRDDQGVLTGLHGASRDITDRKKAEEALRESEEKFRQIVERSSDVFYRQNVDNARFEYMSPMVYGMLGYTSDEIMMMGIEEQKALFHPDDLANLMNFSDELIEADARGQGFIKREFRIRHRKGEYRWVQGNYNLIRNKECNPRLIVGSLNDITDQKRVENELRESEVRYRRIADTVTDYIFTSYIEDGEVVKTIHGPGCVAVTGYTAEEFAADPYLWFNMVFPEDHDRVRKYASCILTGKNLDPIEHRIRRKDGGVRWVLNTPVPHYDSSGALISYDGLISDITLRKQAEEALRENEIRYQSIFENTGTVMLIIEEDMTISFANAEFENMTGYPRQEVEGKKKWTEFVEKSDLEMMIQQHQFRRTETKLAKRSYEFRLVHRDGRIKDIFLIVDIIPGTKKSVASLIDISARKRAEEAVRLNSQRTQALLQLGQMAEATLQEITDFALEEAIRLTQSEIGYLAFLNKDESVLTMHSWSKSAMAQCAIADKPIHYPVVDTGLWGEAVRQRKAIITNEYAAPNPWKKGYPDGHVHVARHMNVPVLDGHRIVIVAGVGNKKEEYTETDTQQLMLFMQGMWRLIERKRAEEEKRSLEERLQHAQKMEALGQLAGGVAHDLNNVLGGLVGYSELLLMDLPEDSRYREHILNIHQSGLRGAAIIQDLLTLARRGVTTSDVINLNRVVSGFIKTPMFEKMKDSHPNVTFSAECDETLLNIKGSAVHLEKTLVNLVLNAAESISGEGKVTIRTQSRYLDKAIRGYDEVKEGDYAVLTVSDTGIGIPDENKEKIFEPFYTKKTMGRSGTGLGLAIVWGTVKDHNGYIDLQTEVGQGSTFTLYFPVTREEAIATQRKEPIERYMGNRESVLVVDDVAEQRDVASKLLMKLGYEVHMVSSGEEAVEYLKGDKADILVLDMIMVPGIDGLETYQRALKINPKQKAILVSGFSETDRVRKAQKLGAGAYVKKPYVMEKIGVAIRDELNR